MGTTKRLQERFALDRDNVDRANGVIHGVLVCGTESANGRQYPWGAGLTCDPAVYEGRPVNCDHGKAATVDRRLGWLANVRVGSDGRPRADLHVLTSHPMAARVLEAAERNPSLFGLSHVAVARTRMDRGTEIIEAIQSVESVDLVADPATTRSLYESTNAMPTFRKFLESVGTAKHAPRCRKWAASKIVREMDEMMGDMPADMPPPPPADASESEGDSAISDAFLSVLMALAKKMHAAAGDKAAAKAIASQMVKASLTQGDISGDGTVDAADVDAAGDTEDMPEELEAAESKGIEKGKALVYEAVGKVVNAGLPVTTATLQLAASVSDLSAVVKTVRESATVEKPKTSGRTTTVTESKQPTDTTPAAKSVVDKFRRPA